MILRQSGGFQTKLYRPEIGKFWHCRNSPYSRPRGEQRDIYWLSLLSLLQIFFKHWQMNEMDVTEKRSAIHSLGERKFATHLEVIAPNGISCIFLPLCFISFFMKRFPSHPFGVVFSKIQNVAAWSHKAQNEYEKSFHFKYPIQNFGESAQVR